MVGIKNIRPMTRNLSPLCVWYTDCLWSDLEKILDKTLDAPIRIKIVQITESYMEDVAHLEDSEEQLRMLQRERNGLTPVTALQNAMKQCFEAWDRAEKDENGKRILGDFEISFNEILPAPLPLGLSKFQRGHRQSALKLDSVMFSLLELSTGLEAHLQEQRHGVNIPDPYMVYINKLLKILKSIGVKVTKSKPTNNAEPLCTSDRFLERLNQGLPKGKKPVLSPDAWAQIRYRALTETVRTK